MKQELVSLAWPLIAAITLYTANKPHYIGPLACSTSAATHIYCTKGRTKGRNPWSRISVCRAMKRKLLASESVQNGSPASSRSPA
jgi:hypothetical protein